MSVESLQTIDRQAELKAVSLAAYASDWQNLKPELLDLLGPMGRMASGGLSICPIASNGSKQAIGRWGQYRRRIPNPIEVATWARRGNGYAIAGGAVSGGLEILDFDDGELYIPWYRACTAVLERHQLPLVATPSRGYHIYYRCAEISGNLKLAKSEAGHTLIETRGEGGYVAGPNNPRSVHSTGRLYLQMGGVELPSVPVISPDERRHLLRAAIAFDRWGVRQKAIDKRAQEMKSEQWKATHPHHDSGFRVGDSFKARATWPSVLEPHGWTRAGGTAWYRPGKSSGGHSANVNPARDGTASLLSVHSSNAGALAPSVGSHKTWDLFAAYAALNHGGDRQAAAKELGQQWYGR